MVNQEEFRVEHNSRTSREVLTMENGNFKLHYEGETTYYLPLDIDDSDKFNAKEQTIQDGDTVELSVKQALVWCEKTGNADRFPDEILH